MELPQAMMTKLPEDFLGGCEKVNRSTFLFDASLKSLSSPFWGSVLEDSLEV